MNRYVSIHTADYHQCRPKYTGAGASGRAKNIVKWIARFLSLLLVLGLLTAAIGLGSVWYWSTTPLTLKTPSVELTIQAGQAPRDIARGWVEAGVETSPFLLYEWFRWSGSSKRMRAGRYAIEHGATPQDLLETMVRGNDMQATVQLLEGWTFRQVRAELARTPTLKPDTASLTDAQIMQALGAPPGTAAEGRFFPDTYAYSIGSSDLVVLKRAYQLMQRQLADAWAQRSPDTPLKSADDALKLASIVEKETGQAAERGLIASVFVNRLRVGMPLQTDPTVIYGLGDKFDGNLRKRDLQTDGPYNTYLRTGLPPTPIALPGKDALLASTRPTASTALYFVSRGDGTSQFSATLAEHNRAVDIFQRRRGK
jgi:UPF0755 protein